ncbi:unnamed protein product [marine sediment metagenome]|uniref:Uncharacterized protein n=1 Tax=marine sediment metagenome TaxID=412755 RepID=X0VF73_9ZZZZ
MADNFRTNTSYDEEMRKFDSYAHAVTVISEPHRMIHDGFMFNASGVVAAVADSASLDILIKRPQGNIGHFTFVEFALDDSPVTVEFFEDVTVSADGTEVNVHNHNRLSSNTPSGATMFTGPTVTDTGTLLHTRYIPSAGAPGNQPAGRLVSGEDAEWVIGSVTADINYLWRITNNSGGAISIGYHFNGYLIGYID